MPAIKDNTKRSSAALHTYSLILLSFHAEYVKRKFILDLDSDPSSWEDLRDASNSVHARMVEPPYHLTPEIESERIIKCAVALVHNSVVDNPKYAFDRRRLPPFYAQAYPLMQDRFPQLLALRNIAFKYGFFFEDLIKPIKGEDLTRYAVENSVPKPPLPFPRIDSDKRDICRFNYVGMDGKQYFEKENDGYIYVYLDALSADEEEYKNQIETIPGKIKSARNVKRSVYGNIRSATMQICLKKTFEKNRSKISSGFVGLQ